MIAEVTAATATKGSRLQSFFIESEVEFYSRYAWCLNPFPTAAQVIESLRAEVGHLDGCGESWQAEEVTTNIFLLACSLSDTADDCLSGKRYDFSRMKRKLRPFGSLLGVSERILNTKQGYELARLKSLSSWRERWEEAVHGLLRTCVHGGAVDRASYRKAAESLVHLLDQDFPAEFTRRNIKSPRAFRSQDYTFKDIVRLAERFCDQFKDNPGPYLVIGLRTAGSYFGPILRATMANLGCQEVDILTLRPKNGATRREMEVMQRCSARNGHALIIDEPVYRGETLGICIPILQKAGFTANTTVALFPVHPSARDWQHTDAAVALNGCRVITILPEETDKYARLQNRAVEETLRPYLMARGWSNITVGEDVRSKELNDHLSAGSDEGFTTRLKRVFSVHMQSADGESVTRYIIAKSVGHGWMGYQAFFTARGLAAFVPPVLGFRNGILYSEWVGSGQPNTDGCDRKAMVERVASYVATRVRVLGFSEDPSPVLCRAGLQVGTDILVNTLSAAYRHSLVARMRRYMIRREIAMLPSPFPTLVDGRNRRSEWIADDLGLLKADFEQHAMGRMDLSVTDPAYDLSECVLSLGLSYDEERSLLDHYVRQTGDSTVAERLPLYKFLAGVCQMGSSLGGLGDPKLTSRHAEFNKAYVDAWTFSMVQMARLWATLLPEPKALSAKGPIVFADVDGVIDQHVFDFPTTTASGIRALALLRAHGIPVYLDTARSIHDVKEYCAAYGLAGGVAESGSCFWDAATGREESLVGTQAAGELDQVRRALERVPGVFINHFYRYSIKAFTYVDGGTVPLPKPLVQKILAQVGAKTLVVHHTPGDSAITARDVDKGTGLRAVLKSIGKEGLETIAIGDTGPDLAMFRVATRSYAPSHTPIRSLATLVGCRVVGGAYQTGFLEIVRQIVHPDGSTCKDCVEPDFSAKGQTRILLDLITEIEKSPKQRLVGALLGLRKAKRAATPAG